MNPLLLSLAKSHFMNVFPRSKARRLLPGFLAAGLLVSSRESSFGNVRLPGIFSEHMVLQSGNPVPVWGEAAPQENVTVEIAGQTLHAQADPQGHWKVQLQPLSAGAKLTLTVRGENTVVVPDVLAGEVWLGSGQSNMAFPVETANHFPDEQATAHFPEIRMFRVGGNASLTPLTDCKGAWLVCQPETVGKFSAALYFFGRELHQRLKVPVGLINASWGGTPIQAWISLDAQRLVPELNPEVEAFEKLLQVPFDNAGAEAILKTNLIDWNQKAAKAKAQGKPAPRKPVKPYDPRHSPYCPGNLFNAMIAPVVPYGLKGVVWYQGEQNGAMPLPEANHYRLQLPALIRDWRGRWQAGDFPFAWVQLPGIGKRPIGFETSSGFELVREGMLETLSLTNTGMAVGIDIGEPDNIHPTNKQDVGHRLALWALAQVYQENLPFSGPIFAGSTVQGAMIKIQFTHTDGGLVCHGDKLNALGIAGTDKVWHPAVAEIDGDTIRVSNPAVIQPVAVRYGWAKDPECNLYNGAGLPASPFRTDRWD